MTYSQPMLRWPEPLNPGDRVRIIAPSGAFDRERFLAGLELMRAAGLVPVMRDDLFAKEHYLAGSDARRLAELEEALADGDAKAIWVARGGYGAARVLPGLRERVARCRPRWLVGFSDATALHAAWAQAGFASVHGANVTTLPTWSEEARAELFALLFAPTNQSFVGGSVAGPARDVEGPLVGGNLTVLASMAGTGYIPSWRDGVVLLEDVGEKPYRLDRSLTQLVQAGAFVGARGIVIGQLTSCEEPANDRGELPPYSAREAVVAALGLLGLPVLTGLPLGHEPGSRAVVLGAHARLDAARATLTVGASR